MITIILEGNTWEEISREMDIAQEAIRRSRIEAKPEDANIAKDYEKCPERLLRKLQWILGEYFLGPEERAEILERMR